MEKRAQPDKYEVRQWLQNQLRRHVPPPSPAEIRTALHWQESPLNKKFRQNA